MALEQYFIRKSKLHHMHLRMTFPIVAVDELFLVQRSNYGLYNWLKEKLPNYVDGQYIPIHVELLKTMFQEQMQGEYVHPDDRAAIETVLSQYKPHEDEFYYQATYQ